jgi:hypothetical protein
MEALTVGKNYQLYQNLPGKCLLFVSVLFVLSVAACGPSQELKNLKIFTAKEVIKKDRAAVKIGEVRNDNYVKMNLYTAAPLSGPSEESKNIAISTAKEAIKRGHPAVEIGEVRIKNYVKMNLDSEDPLNGITEKWIFNITYAWIDTTDNNVATGELEVPIYKKNEKYIAGF